MTKGYEAGSELHPCLRCGSRKFWFDDDLNEWRCSTCDPLIVDNVVGWR